MAFKIIRLCFKKKCRGLMSPKPPRNSPSLVCPSGVAKGGGDKGAIAPSWAVFICIVYLDYLIESMDARFNQRLIDVMSLEGLIPTNLNMYDDENIKAAKIYAQDFHDDTSSTIRAGLFIWK
jgi:hypothetical protein